MTGRKSRQKGKVDIFRNGIRFDGTEPRTACDMMDALINSGATCSETVFSLMKERAFGLDWFHNKEIVRPVITTFSDLGIQSDEADIIEIIRQASPRFLDCPPALVFHLALRHQFMPEGESLVTVMRPVQDLVLCLEHSSENGRWIRIKRFPPGSKLHRSTRLLMRAGNSTHC